MYLTSIYSPSNILNKGSAVRWLKQNWWIASIIIAFHFLAMYLWILKPDIEQPERLDEVVIDLSIAPIISKTPFEERKQEYLEKKEMPDAAKPARGSIAAPSPVLPVSPASSPVLPAQPSEAAQVMESTASVKLNEQPIKPIKVDKVEPLAEKKIPLPPAEKVEEKKLPPAPQPLAPQAPAPQPLAKPQPQPLPEEVIPNMLPAIVDKKNKDKDAPEVAPPAASASAGAAAAAAAPVDSSKGGGSSSTSSAGGASAPAASAAPAPTSALVGRPGPPAPSTAEMQGQIASPKSNTLGSQGGNAGTAGTADADYKSDGLKNAQPNYPLYARKMNQEGVVILSVEVLTDGSAGEVRVATSSGIRLLDKAALEAVKEWNFKPAKKDGVLYVQRLRVPIVFSLSSK